MTSTRFPRCKPSSRRPGSEKRCDKLLGDPFPNFVRDDRAIPIERNAFKDVIKPDGTETTVGLAIHLIDQRGGGTVIRDAGWVRFLEDNTVVREPPPLSRNRPGRRLLPLIMEIHELRVGRCQAVLH